MINQLSKKFAAHKHICFEEIYPGFPVIQINNNHAQASISIYGAHLLSFQPHDQVEPVIWLSKKAIFQSGKAIRGGIPLCWPWFGGFNGLSPDVKQPAHGFARISFWEVVDIVNLPDGATQVELKMPCQGACLNFRAIQTGFDYELNIRITIGSQLTVELITTNRSDKAMTISNALHSYFQISHIDNIVIQGLENINYLDKLSDGQSFLQSGELPITSETDRIYLNTENDIQLIDSGFNRTITISKQNSLSTVVWNPWLENTKAMSDMADDGWESMVCIEAANVASNTLEIEPNCSQHLACSISVHKGL